MCCWFFFCVKVDSWRMVGSNQTRISMRKKSLQHTIDSSLIPQDGAELTAGRGAGGWFNSLTYMFMSNVLSPMSWIDHWCRIWQWLTVPVIAVCFGKRANYRCGTVRLEHAGIAQPPTNLALDITSRCTMVMVFLATWLMDGISSVCGIYLCLESFMSHR